MSSSISTLVEYSSEGLHNKKSCNEYISIENNELIFKSMNCNKDLINRFPSKYEFCDKDINKFILLLRKGVYPYEYMDSWKRFDERLLPNKKDFYSDLNMKGITEAE